MTARHGTAYFIETVYVGSAGHLRRYKVVDAWGKYVPGGLFKTMTEAQTFIEVLIDPLHGEEES